MKKCPFCNEYNHLVIAAKNSTKIIYNLLPATEGHVLITTQRHVQSMIDLTKEEISEVFISVQRTMEQIKVADSTVEGFNVFWLDGKSAGQMIPHFHIHIIPRKKGDGLEVMKKREGEKRKANNEEVDRYKNIIHRPYDPYELLAQGALW